MTLYKIYYGLGGGFGGATDFEILDLETMNDAEMMAYDLAADYALMFDGSHGLPDFNEIKERENCSDEEADEIYHEELDSWLDYRAEVYDEENN